MKDGVLFRGFLKTIDHYEWSEWMSGNDCNPASLKSAVVRAATVRLHWRLDVPESARNCVAALSRLLRLTRARSCMR